MQLLPHLLFPLLVLHLPDNLLLLFLRDLDPFGLSLGLRGQLGPIVQRFVEFGQGAMQCFEVREGGLFDILFLHLLVIDEGVGAVVEVLVAASFTLLGNVLGLLDVAITCYLLVQLLINSVVFVDLNIASVHGFQVQDLIIRIRIQQQVVVQVPDVLRVRVSDALVQPRLRGLGILLPLHFPTKYLLS